MYKKLKKIMTFPVYFTFKIICFNKKNAEKNILNIFKKIKIKIHKKNIYYSTQKKYISFSITIYAKKFKCIKYIYENVGILKFVKIIL
ncbi:DUF493 family protein [Buchnera aphidicola]|uniref:DUF493 family protein n=1 Tax=Buchnera aphidicola TaxID=9 RepID=UPI0039C94911|nr:DUF493 family protein [Buchnera aphidicola (Chaitophorus viminalis)]